MWNRATLLLLAACAITPVAVAAQDDLSADFRAAHEQYAAGQPRQAANTLLRSTLYIRQQVGRSTDEVVGMQLLNAESELEKLAFAMREGRGGSLERVDAALVRIDRLLAQHHVQTARGAIGKRGEDATLIARDIQRGVFHFERTFTLVGGAPAGDAMTVLADVRALAGEIDRTRTIPKTAVATLTVFERQILGTTVVVASGSR
jgi:hypothetical protein